jgi:hypothetical protein
VSTARGPRRGSWRSSSTATAASEQDQRPRASGLTQRKEFHDRRCYPNKAVDELVKGQRWHGRSFSICRAHGALPLYSRGVVERGRDAPYARSRDKTAPAARGLITLHQASRAQGGFSIKSVRLVMRVTAYADRCGIGQVDSNLWSLAFLRRRNETSEKLKQRPDTSTWASFSTRRSTKRSVSRRRLDG